MALLLGGLLLAVGIGMLWSAFLKLEDPQSIPTIHSIALWVAAVALLAKELLFRYMLAVAKRVKSSMLVANAWHARSDAASSLVVGIGITGNLAGYPILDPIAALIVGCMVTKMGWKFGWDALHDLMDRSVDDAEVKAIRETLEQTPGVSGVHDVRTRKMGDMIVVDAHIEVDADISVEAGHEIAVAAQQRVLQRHCSQPVLCVCWPPWGPRVALANLANLSPASTPANAAPAPRPWVWHAPWQMKNQYGGRSA